MKNLLLLLLLALITACNGAGKGDSSSDPVLNSELENGVWAYSYLSGGGNIMEDRIEVQDGIATYKIYNISAGIVLLSTEIWTLTAVDSNTASVNDGSSTFNIDYEIDGNDMLLCNPNPFCSTFTR